MSSTTSDAAPAPSSSPPKRTVALIHVLRITAGDQAVYYSVEDLRPDPSIGDQGVRLTRLFPSSDGQPDHGLYDLIRTPHGWECSCADFNYRRRNDGTPCKHLAACAKVKLIDLGDAR